jgi:predicted metal-dependent hydrolase
MEIKIIKSKNRRRSASAKKKNGVLVISVPWFLPETEIHQLITHFLKRFEKRKIKSEVELKQRADELNRKYFQGKINDYSIVWSTRQKSAYGICNYRQRAIRISIRLKAVPSWVLDATIVHELAHLIEPNHSARFHTLINKYPLTERAKGYLIGLEDSLNKRN